MRVTIRQTPALLIVALAAACASRAPLAPPARPPAPPSVAANADAPPIAAQASAVFVLRHAPGANPMDAPPEIQRMRLEMKAILGLDIVGAPELARLGADPKRPIVASWAIVDAVALRALLASPKFPARDAFAIRYQIVIPVVDGARVTSALSELAVAPTCASATAGPELWAAALARLEDAADRRAADRRAIACFCRDERKGLVARFDGARRELTWVVAVGSGALLADAAAPVALDGPLAARLQHDGLFAARAGVYATPADEARLNIATDVIKIQTGIAGADGDLRDRLWRQGVWETTANNRLVESDPRLFADILATDRGVSWTLTAEGRAFFSSLDLAPGTDAAQLRAVIARQLKPTGLFADRKALVQTVQEAGGGAFMLIKHFLWPHAAAFAAAHPDDAPSGADWGGAVERVELDTNAGVLRMRASGPK